MPKKIKPQRKRCKNCKSWDDKICINKHMRIGDPLGDRCEGCKKDVWLNDEGANVGKDVEEMEKLIKEVTDGLMLQTGKNFYCIHWSSKYE